MKIAGTKVDIPVPTGWTCNYDAVAEEIVLTGRSPDTTHLRNRSTTIVIPVTDGSLSGRWSGVKGRVIETRERVREKWDYKTRAYGASAWRPSRSNCGYRLDRIIFDLARGEFG